MFKWLLFVFLLSSCALLEAKPPTVLDQIKIKKKQKGYFIPLQIENKTYDLRLDTKKSSTSISKSKVQKIGQKKYNQDGKIKDCAVLKANKLTISKTSFMEHFFEDCGENYISLEFFNPHPIEIDFKNKRLKFLDRIGGGLFGASSLRKNKNGDFLFKFFIGSRSIKTVLDTNINRSKISVDFINKNPDFFKKIGKALYETKVFGGGKRFVVDFEGVHFSKSAQKNLSSVDAVIGLDVLKNYSLVLDVNKKKYRIID